MANTFLNPSVIAEAALATLYENTVAAQLVHRDYSNEFSAKVGDTVNVRKPAVFTANEFDPVAGISIQTATESSVPVVLNHYADVSFEVTSKDMTLKVEDFRAQLLDPALMAIAQKIDRDILAFRNDITAEVGVTSGREYGKPEALIDAATKLNLAKVPTDDRHAIIGAATNGEWLNSDLLKRVDESGSTEALREAFIGRRLFGFNPYWSNNIEQPKAPGSQVTGDPTTEVGVAFHRTAVALVTRPLELPAGAANAAILDYNGFGIRVVIGYDQSKKKDVNSLDTLYGVKTLDANRAVLIKGADKA
jgi:hypothetical protein